MCNVEKRIEKRVQASIENIRIHNSSMRHVRNHDLHVERKRSKGIEKRNVKTRRREKTRNSTTFKLTDLERTSAFLPATLTLKAGRTTGSEWRPSCNSTASSNHRLLEIRSNARRRV